MAKLLLSVLGAVTRCERELIRERQREGIELAKRAAAYKGRKRRLAPAQRWSCGGWMRAKAKPR